MVKEEDAFSNCSISPLLAEKWTGFKTWGRNQAGFRKTKESGFKILDTEITMADTKPPSPPFHLHRHTTQTWMACTRRLLSSRAAEAVEVPKEAAPRCRPRMMRPSLRYCSMGSQKRSRRPWTGGREKEESVGRRETFHISHTYTPHKPM